MTISGMNANGISSLFSSLNSSSSSSGMFGVNISDYGLIRSGSYYKLMKSYYAKDTSNIQKTKDTFGNKYNTSTSKETNSTLTKIKSGTDELNESAKALYSSNAKVFKKVTTTDEDGKISTDYDRDAIYKAVNSFVEDYNNVIKASGKSDADGIARAAASMVNMTNQNADSLKTLGISINKDSYTLSIDKDTFMNADVSKIKSVFNGTGSYAYSVAAKSSMLNYQAEREASKTNTYGSTGKYTSNYTSGSVFNGYF